MLELWEVSLQILRANFFWKSCLFWTASAMWQSTQLDIVSFNFEYLDSVNWQVYRLWVELVSNCHLLQIQSGSFESVLGKGLIVLTSKVVFVLIEKCRFLFLCGLTR